MPITIVSTSNIMNGDSTLKEVLVQFGGSNLAHVDYISGTVIADSTFHNLSTDEQHKVVLDKIKVEFWSEPFNEDKIDAINQKVENFTTEVDSKVEQVSVKTAALNNAVARVAKQVLRSDIPSKEYAELLEIFPEWTTGEAYDSGEVVRHKGKAWETIQAHTSQADWSPGQVAALFKEVTPATATDPESGEEVELIPDFVQPTGDHDAYRIGDKVLFEGNVYESTINSNTWTPSSYPQGWTAARPEPTV